jgi:hypothetical protein
MGNNKQGRSSNAADASNSQRGMTRRALLTGSLGACAAPLVLNATAQNAPAIDYSEPVPGSEGLSAYCDDGQVFVRWNNVIVAAYRAHASQKYPYITSLAGPITGISLTTESSLPYPHHRGIWLGCQPLNDGDYWSDGPVDEGQIKSAGPELKHVRADSVVILDKCEWIGPQGVSPCVDERRLTFTFLSEKIRLLDIDVKLTARENLSVRDAKHSFFALRAAPDISPNHGGNLINSEGDVGAAGTHRKAATWCSYYGPRRVRPDVVEGIALMDHPQNPWSPCPWLTRDYGHLSPSPFSFSFVKEPWRLAAGASVRLRYRIVSHAGDPTEAKLSQIYQNWVEGSPT